MARVEDVVLLGLLHVAGKSVDLDARRNDVGVVGAHRAPSWGSGCSCDLNIVYPLRGVGHILSQQNSAFADEGD